MLKGARVTGNHPHRVKPGHPCGRDLDLGVKAVSYEIRIKGKVGEPVLETFGDLDASIKPAETVLRGPITDQAALHGLLDRIQALGLELIEVKQVPETDTGDPGSSQS